MKEKDDREEEEEGPEIISYRGAVFDADAALCRVRVNPSRRRQEGREREVACEAASEAASAATSVNSGNHEKRLLPSWPAAVLSPVTA